MTITDEEDSVLKRVLDVLAVEPRVMQQPGKENMVLYFPELTIYLSRHQVFLEGKEVFLTNLEFGVLLYLAQCPRHVFTKRQIQEAVWKKETESYENAVQCIISGLRKKLKKYSDKEYIRTVRGVGYKFEIPEA